MTPSLPYTDLFIDFDDTLYDTRGNSSLALRELFDHFRLEQHFPSFDTFSQSFWSTNEALWMQYSHGEIDRDTLIVERFRLPLTEGDSCDTSTNYCLKMSDTFLELCSTKPGVVDGAHELLDHLRTRGYRLHICSNGFAEVQHRKIEAAGMRHHFDTVVLSDEAGANKPSAQFFDFAFAQTKADRAHTLMIGDNFSTDIVGAMNVDIDTAFFNRHPESFTAPTMPARYTTSTNCASGFKPIFRHPLSFFTHRLRPLAHFSCISGNDTTHFGQLLRPFPSTFLHGWTRSAHHEEKAADLPKKHGDFHAFLPNFSRKEVRFSALLLLDHTKKAFRHSATSGETLSFYVRFLGEVGAGKSAPAQDAAKH